MLQANFFESYQGDQMLDGRGIWNAKKKKNHSNVFELYQGDQLWVGRGIWNVKERNIDL